MAIENYDLLATFAVVARERSFTRAAVKLGMSQPALSRAMRSLEEHLGVRLLARTTRSVSPTEAGEHLLQVLSPRFEEIDAELALLSKFQDRPAGKLRVTTGEHPAITILQPALAKLLPNHPDIHVEVIVDYGMTDIVAEGFDAGIRLGEQVAKDMIAVRIGPDMRMAVVGSPEYFKQHPQPVTPHDLTQHNCITIRLPTHGIFAWEFEKKGEALKVRVDGQLVFNSIAMRLDAALRGLGMAYMPEDLVTKHIKEGQLIRVLTDWCPLFQGYHLYYPSRRQTSLAFTLFRDTLRYSG